MTVGLRPQRDFPEIMLPLREIAAIGTRHIQADELYTKSISGQVYADIPYDAALILEEDILPSRVNVYVNGDHVESHGVLNGQRFTLNFIADQYPRGDIFRDCYGYIRMEVELLWDTEDRESQSYVTDYLVVMLRATSLNRSIQRMAEYVYRQHRYFLWRDKNRPYGNVQLSSHEEKSLDTLVAIVKTILRVYEHNTAFFRTNPHTKAETTYRIDDFSKLQAITSQTLRYMVQHPDELTPTDIETGIHCDNCHYLPRHTLIANKQRVRDTYENQAVLGFIHEIALETRRLIERIDYFLLASNEENPTTNGYISSATYILQTTRHNLLEKKNELLLLNDALTETYWVYKKLLQIDDIPVSEPPKPTAVFMSLSPYRQIYDVMIRWFTHGVYDFSGEEFLLPLLINNQLYEYYNLFKLAEAIETNGYQIDSTLCKRHLYAVGHENYRDTEHINTFVFSKNDSPTITLYFQPVIWGYNYSESVNNGIALRRTTSLSFDRHNNQAVRSLKIVGRSSTYYTPDYVLKCSGSDADTYLIVDAKLSPYDSVIRYQVEELAYKYLFSIQPSTENSVLLGVLILYGKNVNKKCELESVHDLYHAINTPDLWLTSLTESEQITASEQMATLSRVIAMITKKSVILK